MKRYRILTGKEENVLVADLTNGQADKIIKNLPRDTIVKKQPYTITVSKRTGEFIKKEL
jgi:hypothetical protein